MAIRTFFWLHWSVEIILRSGNGESACFSLSLADVRRAHVFLRVFSVGDDLFDSSTTDGRDWGESAVLSGRGSVTDLSFFSSTTPRYLFFLLLFLSSPREVLLLISAGWSALLFLDITT